MRSSGSYATHERQAPWFETADPESTEAGTRWWEEITARGGEGMVVKPLDFVARGRHGLVQPGIKCRGKEYLRIIYGPEYTSPTNLERLRSRRLGTKRSLALGVEALERFVRREPLYRVHECVFDVLALRANPWIPDCSAKRSRPLRTHFSTLRLRLRLSAL